MDYYPGLQLFHRNRSASGISIAFPCLASEASKRKRGCLQDPCPGTIKLLNNGSPLSVSPKEGNVLKVSTCGFPCIRYRYVSHSSKRFSAYILAQPLLRKHEGSTDARSEKIGEKERKRLNMVLPFSKVTLKQRSDPKQVGREAVLAHTAQL